MLKSVYLEEGERGRGRGDTNVGSRRVGAAGDECRDGSCTDGRKRLAQATVHVNAR